MSTWWDFVKARLDRTGMTQMALAAEIGVDKSVVSDWKNKGAMASSKNARAVAHVFDDPEIDALVAAGHAVPNRGLAAGSEQAAAPGPPDRLGDVDLSGVSDELILREVAARMSRGGARVQTPGTKQEWELARSRQDPLDVGHDTEGPGWRQK